MDVRIGDVHLHYAEHGDGTPLVALHGAGVDHRDLEAALEPLLARSGLRRIYPDLPGMGATTGDGLASNNDVVDLFGEFIGGLGAGPVLLLGHSYGGYLARGIADRYPDAVAGLALLCPAAQSTGPVPAHEVAHEDAGYFDGFDPALQEGFDEYFIVRTHTNARRYVEDIEPGTRLNDDDALGRIFGDWPISVDSAATTAPTLILAARGDSIVGWEDAAGLLERYPHARVEIVEGAGHAMMHERPEALGPVLAEWIDQST